MLGLSGLNLTQVLIILSEQNHLSFSASHPQIVTWLQLFIHTHRTLTPVCSYYKIPCTVKMRRRLK